MTRLSRPAAVRRHRSGRVLGGLLALAVVVTAGAPSVITVRPGDTLWDLARTHGTSVQALRDLNGLPGNAGIDAGDTLKVPGGTGGSGAAAPAGKAGTHVVRAGETLSHLAARYGTTSAAIRAANGLSGSTIVIGKRLAIPGGAARSTGTAAVPTTNAGYRIPESVRSSVARNREILAGRSVPSKTEVRRLVAATARKHGVSPSLAVAVAYHESGFQQRVVSGVNAIGVMQVLPSTGRVLGQQYGLELDLLDTRDNITAGVLLLRQLQRSTGSDDRTLAAYYQGLGSIARKGLLPQTHTYIRNITALRNRFSNG
jgi:soluble lytic murein transglycosylase-like protein